MLDDAQKIGQLDKGNTLGIIAGQPEQLKQKFQASIAQFEVKNIIVAGMGGSALAGEFVRAWLGDRLAVPLTIVRDYALPAAAGPGTLAVISSYSGNTEETLACLEQARQRNCRIVIMASGGKLKEAAASGKHPFLELPGGFHPRLAILYGVKALAETLEQLGLASGLTPELEQAADWLAPYLPAWTLEKPAEANMAKQLAESLLGCGIVVYGGPTLAMPARKWKINFNENAKNIAFWYELPEFSHNEFQGWQFPADLRLKVVELQSGLDHPQITKRFAISNRLLSAQMPAPVILQAAGDTKLRQMLWAIVLGDFVSAYLAFLNGVDPGPVPLVEKLKKELQ